ncbi:hypothetical protein B0H10DRAFT_2067784 [Mycena sp. CBHHK59/15]|nr:hypothetical protein B0H10DRAFT_2067784 [Mycena sp. CBHHK59/15]
MFPNLFNLDTVREDQESEDEDEIAENSEVVVFHMLWKEVEKLRAVQDPRPSPTLRSSTRTHKPHSTHPQQTRWTQAAAGSPRPKSHSQQAHSPRARCGRSGDPRSRAACHLRPYRRGPARRAAGARGRRGGKVMRIQMYVGDCYMGAACRCFCRPKTSYDVLCPKRAMRDRTASGAAGKTCKTRREGAPGRRGLEGTYHPSSCHRPPTCPHSGPQSPSPNKKKKREKNLRETADLGGYGRRRVRRLHIMLTIVIRHRAHNVRPLKIGGLSHCQPGIACADRIGYEVERTTDSSWSTYPSRTPTSTWSVSAPAKTAKNPAKIWRTYGCVDSPWPLYRDVALEKANMPAHRASGSQGNWRRVG